jgi:hypothetical protein
MTTFEVRHSLVGVQRSVAGVRTASGAFTDSSIGGGDHANANSRNIGTPTITSLVPDTESNTRNCPC